VLGILFTCLLILFSACEKGGPTEKSNSASIDADSDAAESVSSAVGEDTGGLMDGVGYLFDLSGGAVFEDGFAGLSKAGEVADAVYDPNTGIWTISFSREYGNASGPRYAYVSRTVTVRFLDKNGKFQRRYIVGSDTAAVIEFNILSGSGRHWTRRLSQKLNSLTASFVATGTNTDTITVNGSYRRAATDTITTKNAKRTLDYVLNLDAIHLQGPLGNGKYLLEKVSGTVSGTFSGHVTFEKGATYKEKDIARDISITVSDSPIIRIGGRQFRFDLKTGELGD
jgi:hypothetical protein